MDKINRCLAISYISNAPRRFSKFQADMNGMYKFLINKPTKQVGRDITGTTIDRNN